MTAAEFFDRCAEHDWTYNFSESGARWRRGEQERQTLLDAVREDHALYPLWRAWLRWYELALVRADNNPQPRREDFVRPVSTFPAEKPVNSYRDGTPNPDQLKLT